MVLFGRATTRPLGCPLFAERVARGRSLWGMMKHPRPWAWGVRMMMCGVWQSPDMVR